MYSIWILRYVQYFPPMKEAIKSRQHHNLAQNQASTSSASFPGDAEGHVLVGFGPYKHMSRFDLYHSPQDEHKKYVRSILQITVTHPGGQMDKLKSYIQTQHRLEKENAEDDLLIKLVDELEQTSQSEDLRVPPPPPPPLPDVTSPVHSEVPSALEKVIRILVFTVSYSHVMLPKKCISVISDLECWGTIPLQLGTIHTLMV